MACFPGRRLRKKESDFWEPLSTKPNLRTCIRCEHVRAVAALRNHLRHPQPWWCNSKEGELSSHCLLAFSIDKPGDITDSWPAPRLNSLRQRISGFVFLSSPHSTSLSEWGCVPLILETYLGSKSEHTMTPEMTSGLADDYLTLKKLFDQVPVLSIYKTEETRTGSSFWTQISGTCHQRSRYNWGVFLAL